MFSQLFIMSARGDTIAFRDFRGELTRESPEIFYKNVKSNSRSHSPFINIEEKHFIYIQRSGLYFVCVTTDNIAPVFALEFLNKLVNLCKEYCGELSELSIQSNFALIYELLDEILDFGFPQNTSTDLLHNFIFNQPLCFNKRTELIGSGLFGGERRHIPNSSANRSVLELNRSDSKNEIFLDVLEKLVVLISPTGSVIRSEINGCINIKSFISGSADISIILSENVVFCNMTDFVSNSLVIDEYTFHESVNTELFEQNRQISFKSFRGELTVLDYHIYSNSNRPLKLHPFMEVINNSEIRLRLKLVCDIAATHGATSITVCVNVPKSTSRVLHESSDIIEYDSKEGFVKWNIKRIPGGGEKLCYIKFLMPSVTLANQKEIGPVSLYFEIPSYVCSKLQIKSLRVQCHSIQQPKQWIRYITHTDSYVFRL
ncbi:AP-4 complex subunit mu-1 [Hydra vulgaris]|uniref:AP-4 complex subunit mu-1 n=1 Tax=Hydra vulgaris TaxID=6087 RepID=A0ABM4CN32_HYDVU